MDALARAEKVMRFSAETLTPAELARLFETRERPRAYIGFEPSGRLTVGHLVCIRKMRDLQEAGCDLTIFLADWHAWINDKLGGSLERIAVAGRYMQAVFTAFGVDPSKATYRWASELAGRSEYWARVVQVAKATSLARTKRAMTVLGRSEEESQLDTAKLFYPAMQVADIFELPTEIAYAGLDQRRAHVLAREVAHHYDWTPPVALHTPLIPSLSGGGRMDAATDGPIAKMSKSDPASAIPLPATESEIREKIRGAFCEAKQVEGNPVVEIARHVLLPWRGTIAVERAAQHGGPIAFEDAAALIAAWSSGSLHPMDLKNAVVRGLSEIVAAPSEALKGVPGADGQGL